MILEIAGGIILGLIVFNLICAIIVYISDNF